MVGVVIMGLLMWVILNTFESIMVPMNFPVMVSGIKSFWSFTKRRLAKFNGVKVNFELHLEECEWRCKKEPETLSKELWEMLENKTVC